MDYHQPKWEHVVNWQLVDHEDRIARLENLVKHLTLQVSSMEHTLLALRDEQARREAKRAKQTKRKGNV